MSETSNLETLLQQGHNQLDRGQFHAGLCSFQAAEKLEPKNPDVLYGMGLANYCLENYEKSVEYFEQAFLAKSTYIMALARLGMAYKVLGSSEQASTTFQLVKEIAPQSYEDWRARGIAMAELQDYQEALRSYERAIELQPKDHEALRCQANTLVSLKKRKEAIKKFDEVLQLKPDYFSALVYRGITLANLGQNQKAINDYNKALELKHDAYEVHRMRGLALANLERNEEAVASYEQALEINPDFYQAWHSRGLALKHLGRYADAIESYSHALEIKPDYVKARTDCNFALFLLLESGQYESLAAIQARDPETWRSRGIALSNLGRGEEAIESFDRAIQLKDSNPETWRYRGITLGNLGRGEEAIESFDRAIQLKDSNPETWRSRGIALSNLGRGEEAIESFDRAIQLKDSNPETWRYRGIALSNLGCGEEAIESFDQAIQLKDSNPETWRYRGIALGNLGRGEEAIKSFDQAIQLKDSNPETWRYRGIALGNLGRGEEAIKSFDQAIQLKDSNPETWRYRGIALSNLGRGEEAVESFDQAIQLKDSNPETWRYRGIALSNLGRGEEALESFDRAIELQPDYSQNWYNRGNALLNLQQYEQAIASFDQALELQADYYQAWARRGDALSNLEQYEQALASYDQALEIESQAARVWGQRGYTLMKLERNQEAVESFDRAIELQSDYSQNWYNRGNALLNLQQYEQAIASFDQALELQADYYPAWVRRGDALLNLEQYEQAVASYDQALEIESQAPTVWRQRGYTLMKLERNQEAVESFDRAIELQPDYSQNWYNRGNALLNLQQYEQTIASFDRAIALQADYYQAWYSRGNAMIALGLYDEALATYDCCLNFADELSYKVRALNGKGNALRSLERYDEAILAYRNALNLSDNKHWRAWNNLGWALFNSGAEYGIALQAWEDGLNSIQRETQDSEYGYGILNYSTGKLYYIRGQELRDPLFQWQKAQEKYNNALQSITSENEKRLEIIQDLLKVHLGLKQTDEAEELTKRGSDLLRRLLSRSASRAKQKRLYLKFASFDQLTVDLAVQSGDILHALALAEQGKNTCLRWLLGDEEILSVNFDQINQFLITPNTAAVYWHLSPFALTTFVIMPGAPVPDIVESTRVEEQRSNEDDQRPASLLQILGWEKWVKNWNQQYQVYGSPKVGKKTAQVGQEDKQYHPWRTQMEGNLEQLKQILNIPLIEQHFQSHAIENLILIPHRDLHRFPLHYLFDNFTCSYLPSARFGIKQKEKAQFSTPDSVFTSLLIVENPKSTPLINQEATTLPDLPFTEVEAALIRQMFSQKITSLENPTATRDQLQQTLRTPHQVFHFTGHGAYNSINPVQSCLFLHGTDQLTLPDIVPLDLRGYYLVCLAACETAVTGDQTITDEYVGLVSAFLKAGATYIISTLWTVESAASALLIVEFYQQLQAGQSPAAALKAAQTWLKTATRDKLIEWLDAAIPKLSQQRSLQLLLQDRRDWLDTLDSNDPPFCHPYYWAAFTISGL
jgi:tetratricopeptide (TPR) repeat protein